MTRLLSLTFSRASVQRTLSGKNFDWDKGAFTKANGTEKYLQTGNTFWRNWATDYCTLCREEEVLLCDSLSGCLDGISKGNTMMLMKNYRMNFYSIFDCTTGITIVFINSGLNGTAEEKEAKFAFIASK